MTHAGELTVRRVGDHRRLVHTYHFHVGDEHSLTDEIPYFPQPTMCSRRELPLDSEGFHFPVVLIFLGFLL